MADVRLVIDGREYSGWKEMSVTRALSALSGKFSLTLTDKWMPSMQSIPVYPGQGCQVLLDGIPVITGSVDDVVPGLDKGSRSLRVTGRDKTQDLVDCSVIHSPNELLGKSVGQIARTLCKPFGIDVVEQGSMGRAFDSFKFQPGEKCKDALERAARQRAILPRSDTRGRVVLGSIAQTRADALIEGENILKASAPRSWRNRYSEYTVVGQQQGSDSVSGLAANAVRAVARDKAVSRHRPLLITAETQATQESARERAGWEANVRAAKSATVSVTVQGWLMSDGRLWTVGDVCRVQSASLWLGGGVDLVITSVTFSLGEAGSLTTLELCRADAFSSQPGVDKDVSSLPDLTEYMKKANEPDESGMGWGR